MHKTTIVYYSKTGNTKLIANTISVTLGCNSCAINIMKSGRKTRQENDDEKLMQLKAIEQCNQLDLVIIGTLVEFRKPRAKIIDYINQLQIKNAALLCTYYVILGCRL
jgi:flavodoxin